MTVNRSVELLIRELSSNTKDGRYVRENFRRLKQYLDDLQSGSQYIPVPPNFTPSVYNNVDPFDVVVNGQTTFTLLNTPITPSTSRMVVNGVDQTYAEHFTISGNIATFIPAQAGFNLEAVNEFGQPDKVVFHYMT
jgi:hypothetical protein